MASLENPVGFILSAALVALICIYSDNASLAYGADDNLLSTFGQGKVQVRIYTDYFCSPCRSLEPKIEPLIKELVNDKTITVTFVDAPFYILSSLYSRYFLYTMKKEKDFERLFRVKEALFEASKMKLDSNEKIEAYLNSRNFEFTAFDVRPVFAHYSSLLRGDGIDRTPSCAILKDGSSETFTSGGSILRALSRLRER